MTLLDTFEFGMVTTRRVAGSMMNVTEIQTEPAIIAMARGLSSE